MFPLTQPIYLSIAERRAWGLPFGARGLSLAMMVGKNHWSDFLAQKNPSRPSLSLRHHRLASHRPHHPLDHWSQKILLQQLHQQKKGWLLFPSSVRRGGINLSTIITPPSPPPFQQWAMRAGFSPSPLGLLIHPQYGLWVNFRGAILSHRPPQRRAKKTPSPCASCATTPCVSACPAGAVANNKPFSVSACHDYLNQQQNNNCLAIGCMSRRACPVAPHLAHSSSQNRHQWRGLKFVP